jgi:hypothetical protein
MIIVFRRSAEGGHSASTTGTGDAKGGPFGKFLGKPDRDSNG